MKPDSTTADAAFHLTFHFAIDPAAPMRRPLVQHHLTEIAPVSDAPADRTGDDMDRGRRLLFLQGHRLRPIRSFCPSFIDPTRCLEPAVPDY